MPAAGGQGIGAASSASYHPIKCVAAHSHVDREGGLASSEGEGKLKRVTLLKAIEAATARVFEAVVLNRIEDEKWRQQVRRVVLESNLGGLEEFGEKWYACIKEKMKRMKTSAPIGLSSRWRRIPVALTCSSAHSSPVLPRCCHLTTSSAYLVQKQDPSVIVALKAALPAADDELIQSQYTVVQLTSDNSLIAEPFARYFSSPERAVVSPMLAGFDERIVSYKAAAMAVGNEKVGPWDAAARETYFYSSSSTVLARRSMTVRRRSNSRGRSSTTNGWIPGCRCSLCTTLRTVTATLY